MIKINKTKYFENVLKIQPPEKIKVFLENFRNIIPGNFLVKNSWNNSWNFIPGLSIPGIFLETNSWLVFWLKKFKNIPGKLIPGKKIPRIFLEKNSWLISWQKIPRIFQECKFLERNSKNIPGKFIPGKRFQEYSRKKHPG